MSWVVRHKWGLLCTAAWLLAIASAFLVPTDWLRDYLVWWAGAVVAICGFFGVGYLLLSRPSKNAEGERQWESLWFWVLVFDSLFFFVFLRTFVFGLIIPSPAHPSPEQIQSYQSGVIITSAAFFVILWPTMVWVRLQIQTRRAMRAAL